LSNATITNADKNGLTFCGCVLYIFIPTAEKTSGIKWQNLLADL